jgi:transcriptional regulator with XRE-family HTH domain
MHISELLAAAKAGGNIPSSYRLARLLGVSDNTVNRWQHSKGWPDDLAAARLADLAGLDVGAVVASMHAQRASEPKARELWQAIADRLAATAPAGPAPLGGGGPRVSSATPDDAPQASGPDETRYTLERMLKAWRRRYFRPGLHRPIWVQ